MASVILNRIKWRRTLIVLICFLIYRYSKYFYAYVIFGTEAWNNMPFYFSSSILLATGIIIALFANYILHKYISLTEYGLHHNGFTKGLMFALLFSLPMFVGLSLVSDSGFYPEPEKIYRGIVLAGFGEEFLFRGFLFGSLFFYCGWGFLSAGIIAGLFFGGGHLYQANDIGSAVSIFLFTTGASIGFGWFYYAWKNLWMVIFLHGLMDVIWDGYHIETNVTGNLTINIARFSTLIFAVVVSIRIAKKNGRYDLKHKLWFNPVNPY